MMILRVFVAAAASTTFQLQLASMCSSIPVTSAFVAAIPDIRFRHNSGGGFFGRRSSSLHAQTTNTEPPKVISSTSIDTEDTEVDTSDANGEKEPSLEDEFLKDALLQSAMFSNLPEESLAELVQGFECVEFQENDVIYTQGDTSEDDYVYVVYQGECKVQVDGKEVPRPYGILRPKTIFGELAIQYNQTRLSTVACRTATLRLFRIPCDNFKAILLNQRPVDEVFEDAETTVEDSTDQIAAIDDVIKEIEGQKSLYQGNIIRPYKPDRKWLWGRFSGTILQHVAVPTLLNMAWSVIFIAFVRRKTLGSAAWMNLSGLAPDAADPFIAKLALIRKIWGYQQGLTTFILTFFLNQAFDFWRDIYNLGRQIQLRLNDFNMVLATTTAREKDGSYSDKAESLLDEVGQISRLFHVLLWAANTRRFSILATPRGLDRMASRGLMTPRQLKVLQNVDLPENKKHNACLEWMMIRTDRSIQDGTLISDAAHRQLLLDKILQLRNTYAMIRDRLDGRMPLAYTHFVQILVDTFVWTAPIALYSELGSWSVICVGVLTLFYTGLLGLAKIFLDPLNNQGFCKNSIYMDIGVLIRESNAGSTRWKSGAATLPF